MIDSLISELPRAKNDSNHVNILSAICYYYYEINPTLGLKYGKEALTLAETLQLEYGKAHVYGNLACNYLSLSDYPKALELWTKSLQVYEKHGYKFEIANTLLNMANVYESQADYQKALEIDLNALKVFEEIQRKSSSIVLGNIGYIYFQMNENSKALDYYSRALENYKRDNSKSGVASMLGYMGEVYSKQSDYEKAIEYLMKARMMKLMPMVRKLP